ncbi:MAG TPA: MarR family transcriptional regulator [Acidimicrobiales bacterium]|nr:MarR family transcriptional regulator [Acidimicrobiales bacterium]
MATDRTPDTLDLADTAARLRLSVTRLSRRLRQESTTGLTPSQVSALAVVSGHGPLTLGALAEHERVAPPSITKLVTKLEAVGLVTRTVDPTDRRVTHVSATKAGHDLIGESRRRKTTWLAGRIRKLTPEEQVRLAAALDVLERLHQEDPQP